MQAPVRIRLRPDGKLEQYSLSDNARKRRVALRAAIEKHGSLRVLRRLVVLRTYRKASPTTMAYRRLDSDVRFLQTVRAREKKSLQTAS